MSKPLWSDSIRANTKGESVKVKEFWGGAGDTADVSYITYMWHRQGSLNNDRNISNAERSQTAILEHKIFGSLKYSYFTSYFKDNKNFNLSSISDDNGEESIELIKLYPYNSSEATAIRVGDKTYMGNIDTVMSYNIYNRNTNEYDVEEQPANLESTAFVENGGYPIVLQSVDTASILYGSEDLTQMERDYVYGTEPVSIKTKSIQHLVFKLPEKKTSGTMKNLTLLPSISIWTKSQYDDLDHQMNLNVYIPESGSTMSYEIVEATNNMKGIGWKIDATSGIALPTQEGEYLMYEKSEISGTSTSGYTVWHVKVTIIDSSPVYTYLDDLSIGDVVTPNDKEHIFKITGKASGNIIISGTGFFAEIYKGSVEFSQGNIDLNDSSNPSSFHIDDVEMNYIMPNTNNNLPFLYMVDVYEDISPSDIYGIQRRGGDIDPDGILYDPQGFSDLRWNIVSDPVPLSFSEEGYPRFSLLVSGDTYFQRWDCLKTYPFTEEDKNSVVEIGSFMVETYRNIQSRTDKNRGEANILTSRLTNFDLYNEVYDQYQDFMSNRYLQEETIKNNVFPTTVYWSLNKTIGEYIDTWMKINTTSPLDMDGNKGKVVSLNKLGNNLFCFQEKGISMILYNESTQISTTTGVPIEMANSGMVNGKRYISDIVGSNDKWSIVNGSGALYFVDGSTKGIYKLSDTMTPLSSSLGFVGWSNLNIDNNSWSPNNRNSFLSCYDSTNGEVLFMKDDEALVYSEQLGQFTSFVDYRHTPYIMSVRDSTLAIWKDGNTGELMISKLEEGDDKSYGRYLGNYDPSTPLYEYSVTLVANPEPAADKVFDVLEFRGDNMEIPVPSTTEGINKKSTGKCPFSRVRIWNEYQDSGEIMLIQEPGKPSNLKRKFRTWRVNNLRDNSKRKGPRDRIRNPWCYIKLIGPVIDEDNTSTQNWIHNIALRYYI